MGVQRATLSEDLDFKKVASDIESSLREITRRSGGDVVFTGDVGSALHAVEQKEDVYYVLTYEPRDPGRKGKVKVELPGHPDARLFYDDNIRADYIGEYLKKKQAEDPEILIDGLALDGRRLRIKVSSFKTVAARKGREGRLDVAIRIRDGQDRQIYDHTRQFVAREERVNLTVDFKFLNPGRYMFLVEARDQLTGKAALDILQAEAD
jgi:hypothetical protein